MKKLLLQSKLHWLMAVPILMLSSDKMIGITLLSTIVLSLIVGVLIEVYQYVGERFVKKKQLTAEYYLYSTADILVTVAGGVLGYAVSLICSYLGSFFR